MSRDDSLLHQLHICSHLHALQHQRYSVHGLHQLAIEKFACSSSLSDYELTILQSQHVIFRALPTISTDFGVAVYKCREQGCWHILTHLRQESEL